MATEKVTPMILKVDLQCPSCYKKIKKTLCKFPQIRDQVFDEKANQVMITVVCCSPEKILDKLCYKGGKTIQSIKIVDKPEKKPEQPKPAEKPKPAIKSPEPEKPKPAAEKPEKPKPEGAGKADKPKEKDGPKPEPAKKAAPVAMPPAAFQVMGPGPAIVHGVPSVFPYAGSSPYYHGYGFPPPPPPPQPVHGGGYYGNYGHVNRSDEYFSEENQETCRIM